MNKAWREVTVVVEDIWRKVAVERKNGLSSSITCERKAVRLQVRELCKFYVLNLLGGRPCTDSRLVQSIFLSPVLSSSHYDL